MRGHHAMPFSANESSMPDVVRCGALSKPELLDCLAEVGVKLNGYARELFESDLFATSPDAFTVSIVASSPAALGLREGATLARILEVAADREWRPCPLELAPHLRLQYLAQPHCDAAPPRAFHRAPSGSLTIVSRPLIDDDEFPKGLYLRNLDGVPWLRGYCCSIDYRWHGSDRLVFRTE
jgi:hypothetical protein